MQEIGCTCRSPSETRRYTALPWVCQSTSAHRHSLRARREDRVGTAPVPHKDFSDLYGKMSGEGASAGEAHLYNLYTFQPNSLGPS